MLKTLRTLLLAAILLLSAQAQATIYTVTAGGSSNIFSPSYLTMAVGDTVKWVIASGTHNTLSTAVPTGALNWSSGSMSGTATFSYTPTVAGTYYYECSFHSGMTGTIIVSTGPCNGPAAAAVSSSVGSSTCEGTGAVVLTTSAQAGATYQWYNGTTLIPGATSSSYNIANPTVGNNSYKVKVSRCNIDVFSPLFVVTVNAQPATSFTASGAGATRTFTNTTPGTGMTYSWDFGDGSAPSTAASPTHTYTTAGAKTVKLTATNSSTGCSKQFQQIVQIALGVATINGIDAFTVMPNPATSTLTVHAEGNAPALNLTDFAGRSVKVPVVTDGKDQQIDIRSLPQGLYLLHIITSNGAAVEKVMVMH